MANALTFDLEDWFHSLVCDPALWPGLEDRIVEPTMQILNLLRLAKSRATFFVLSDVAVRHPELISAIHQQGHEIASHGSEHLFVYEQTEEDFARDVARSMNILTSITGEQVLGYRAPYFSITLKSLWALRMLKQLGLKYDSSVYPIINHRYGIPGAKRLPHETDAGITEVPITTFPYGRLNVPCGGGVYFRTLPYSLVRCWYQLMISRGEPIIFYLHPWECDSQQPRMKVTPFLRLRHYWRLHKTLPKLRKLLDDFRFVPVREVIGV